MIEWAVWAIATSSMMGPTVSTTVNYVQSLPPIVDQAQLACQDTKWEKENLVAVGGSLVHKKLGPYVKKALSEARSQNIGLNISVAYRSCDTQLNLRRINCGPGNFNLYQKPSNQCTPPTEPAGRSLHNEGLAVDFSCTGYAVFDNSTCYSWLQKNGGSFHLYNHALESWHWSTTGK